jgi:hypothetical protein
MNDGAPDQLRHSKGLASYEPTPAAGRPAAGHGGAGKLRSLAVSPTKTDSKNNIGGETCTSGMERALYAHADKCHPVKGRK